MLEIVRWLSTQRGLLVWLFLVLLPVLLVFGLSTKILDYFINKGY